MQRRHQCVSKVGWWRSSPPLSATLCILTFAIGIAAMVPQPAAAQSQPAVTEEPVEYAQSISTRLNPSGRTVAYPVPLKDGDYVLGDVVVQITAEDQIQVEKAALLAIAAPSISPAVLEAVSGLNETAGFLPIEALSAIGLNIQFDPGLQELNLALPVEQRRTGDLSLAPDPAHRLSSALAQPEFTSGYVNIIANLDKLWHEAAAARSNFGYNSVGVRLELESALRVGGIVLENRAALEGGADTSICPTDAICSYGHVAGLKRQQTRLIYDLPDHHVRVSAGDIDSIVQPLHWSTEVLGVSIEKTARKLNPVENMASTGSGSFRLERPSAVDVMVNGLVVRRLQLRPGTYNLRDLPLTTGANSIELTITEENGERRTETFSAYSDPGILGIGKNEWTFAAGTPSYLLDNARAYSDANLASGFIRYGLLERLTGELNFQSDGSIHLAGAGADVLTEIGRFGLHGAASLDPKLSGFAANFNWAISNFQGLSTERNESIFISVEFRDADFQTPGEHLKSADGIHFREFDHWLSLAGS